MVCSSFPNPLRLATTIYERVYPMKYGIAWLLGVPTSVLVLWYLFTHV